MRKYFEMNMLGKTRVGFVLQKRGKKRGKNTKIPLWKGGFMQKRTQTSPPCGTGWCRNGRFRSKPQGSQIVQREEPNVLIHNLVFELC
jgi:hypothetical protein